MKHILILLALVFSMASMQAQATFSEQDYQSGLEYYAEGDYEQARAWFDKAANQGHADAQHRLGNIYEYGIGTVVRISELALYWHTRAAEQGHAEAQRNVGFMYAFGHGVAEDYTQAAHWYEKSAKQGNELAQDNLGVLYANGLGVEKNLVLGYMWFIIAERNGSEAAQYHKTYFAKQMSPAQIAEAYKKDFECFRSSYQYCD